MKQIARTFLAIVFLTAAVNSYAQEAGTTESKADPMGLSFGVDYMSTYLWRGGYWFNGDGAFFPSVSFEKAGFSIGYAGEYSEDAWTGKDTDVVNPGIEKKHAADFGIGYSYSVEKLVTIGASVWYYYFYNEDANTFYTGTVSLALDLLPLTPTIAYNHDYYTDSKEKKDYYITLGLSKSIEAKSGEISLGVTAGYYNCVSGDTELKGISDVTASLGASTTVGAVTLSGSFNWVYVPSEDYYVREDGSDDKNRTYATFGASYSL